jgi:hypothetical protein
MTTLRGGYMLRGKRRGDEMTEVEAYKTRPLNTAGRAKGELYSTVSLALRNGNADMGSVERTGCE